MINIVYKEVHLLDFFKCQLFENIILFKSKSFMEEIHFTSRSYIKIPNYGVYHIINPSRYDQGGRYNDYKEDHETLCQ